MTSTMAPAFAELDAATDHTAQVNADPAASLADRQAAAEQEAQLYDAFPAENEGGGGHAGLEAHEAAAEPWPEPEAG